MRVKTKFIGKVRISLLEVKRREDWGSEILRTLILLYWLS